jgi:hypothetical protein
MGIEVAIVTETHTKIETVLDDLGVIARLAMARWPGLTESLCLRFVEPWGDAVFNQTQLPFLLAELHSEVRLATDAKFKEHLQRVVSLVESAQDQAHVYVKFIGD